MIKEKLSNEIKELKKILRDKWVAEWDKGMYYTPNATGVDLYLDDFTTKATELEKQLAEKDEEIKQYCEKAIIDMNYKEMLELQLDKADKEIIELRGDVDEAIYDRDAKVDLYVREIKHIRQRVCEDIREWCKKNFLSMVTNKVGNWVELNERDFYKFLDQIEKGE